jgi:hypothetical protein
VSYPPPPQPWPYWQPPHIDPRQLKPSRLWYWLAGVPAAIGTILAVVLLVVFIEQLDPDIENFQSNREAAVDLKAGDRAIYVQVRENDRPIQLPPGRLNCRVSFVGSDSLPLRLERESGSSLDVNTDSYAAEYSFDAPHDGPYSVMCEGPEGVPLAIGPHLSLGLFAPLVAAIGSFVLGVILAAVIAIVTAIRRSNHKQRLQREARQAQASGLA